MSCARQELQSSQPMELDVTLVAGSCFTLQGEERHLNLR